MLKNTNGEKEPAKTGTQQGGEAKATGYYPGPGVPYPGMELARAYVLIQKLGEVYPPSRALETGTLFPELYRPYPY